MKVGFYAPLKAPDHPVPSGDRTMARLLINVIEACGHDVEVISTLRSWQAGGPESMQAEIEVRGKSEVERLVTEYKTRPAPDLVFTYHVYHKAPDWIGPDLARRLCAPYVMAEASFAPKRHGGPWQRGHEQTLKCIRAARSIISLNPVDSECIAPLLDESQTLHNFRPFLGHTVSEAFDRAGERKRLAIAHGLDIKKPWLITVAMTRTGDKAASYRALANAVSRLEHDSWQLIVIGGGEAFDLVKGYFAAVGHQCVFTGELDQYSIQHWLAAADIFTWPAVNEAYGLALLEAQAAALPAVVQNYGGVASIVQDGQTGLVTPPGNLDEYVDALQALLGDIDKRQKIGKVARARFQAEHSFDTAVRRMAEILESC